jgi:hypothetical protein
LLPSPAPASEDSSSSSSSTPSTTTRPPQSSSPVLDLVLALTDQRLYREVALSLRQGLRDARSEFCFMRVRGLNALAKFLASSAKSQKIIELFQDSQSYQELQGLDLCLSLSLAHTHTHIAMSFRSFASRSM